VTRIDRLDLLPSDMALSIDGTVTLARVVAGTELLGLAGTVSSFACWDRVFIFHFWRRPRLHVGSVADLLGGAGASHEEPALIALRQRCDSIATALRQHCDSIATALRQHVKASPDLVEAMVDEVFHAERPARKRRLLLYAQRLHSTLRPSEVARRYGRRPSAVSMAHQAINAAAAEDAALAAGLATLAERIKDAQK
jgi:hypothetical protein